MQRSKPSSKKDKIKRYLIALLLLLSFYSFFSQVKKTGELFYVKPYLQIGKDPSPNFLQLNWQATDTVTNWIIEYKTGSKEPWKKAELAPEKRLAVKGITPRKMYRAAFTGLVPGKTFTYRMLKKGKVVFTAEAKAVKSVDQPYRFVAFGDAGAGTKEQKAIAAKAFQFNPDLLVIPGDIVYEHGTISEYDTRYWPIYNADKPDSSGVPLLRSVPSVASTGNHDTDPRDLDQFPDGLAYYLLWNLPLNGPAAIEGGPLTPQLKASEANKEAFLKAAGESYPGMTNYSFDYGNTHWTFIDSNPYVDLTSKEINEWLAKDIEAAKDATWRFVVFHHPGFNSSVDHYEQQQTRLLARVMEAGRVDVVFNGHVHNYQRTYPLKFTPDKQGSLVVGKDGKTVKGRVVNGTWTLDKTFDGKTDTTPEGIIYVVTGAGGQKLYNPEQTGEPDTWQKFTYRFIADRHSFTAAEVNGKTLVIKQLTADGKELDAFTVTKQ